MRRHILTIAVVFCSVAGPAWSNEIGFIEDFSLADDRAAVLEQLIPGTEDYYYYTCLHLQNTEQFDKVEQLLPQWIKRHKVTRRVQEIQYRQALLTYERDPDATLQFIREKLNLRFDHQREQLDAAPNLPDRLDPNVISRVRLTDDALRRHKNLDGFEDSALDWLVGRRLNADRRHNLLERLTRPDHPGLVRLVIDDLNDRRTRAFGALPIHGMLLLDQLEQCLKLKPELMNQTAFVNAWLVRLRPNDDVDWRHDPNELRQYFDRLWQFVRRLSPAHNSLKAHVLYHRLVFDRTQGVHELDRFADYIKLPRSAGYVNPAYLRRDPSGRSHCRLDADFATLTSFPPIGNDESLVRNYLLHFFVEADGFKPFEPFLNDTFLRETFAEAKIVNGLGDQERWYSMLTPAKYQALKDRVDIEFAPESQRVFNPDDPVRLDVFVKNVPKLRVRIFEINTASYYREARAEVSTDIDLDGLVANVEHEFDYDDPALRRSARHFEFPELAGRGTWVIDFIGNGRSSRVVVRKGKLRYLMRSSAAGHVFTVLDEQNRKVDKATIHFGGRDYRADDDGLIRTPFSTKPGRQSIVLSVGDFSSFDSFQLQAENYELRAGIHVDRESLISRRHASAIIRPQVLLNGTPASVKVLKNVRLTIKSTDHDGISSTNVVNDFELFDDRESVHDFVVPARLATLELTLSADVRNISRNKDETLQTASSTSLNRIETTDRIDDVHFLKVGDEYFLDLLGRTGESRSRRPVQIQLKHRDFRRPVTVMLQSNARGRIDLGRLTDVQRVTATPAGGEARSWSPSEPASTYHSVIHARAGETVQIPFVGHGDRPTRSEVSLVEVRGSTFVVDRFDALTSSDGLLLIDGLAPGDYDLLLKRSGTRMRLRIASGEYGHGYVLGRHRQLELRDMTPVQIASLESRDDSFVARIVNSSPTTRVHVFATRFHPAFSPWDGLSVIRDAGRTLVTAPVAESLYVEGRNLGDEYTYILQRQLADRFPGNMNERPSLLLNPWAIRSTSTQTQQAAAGDNFAKQAAPPETAASAAQAAGAGAAAAGEFSNLDFLAHSAAIIVNVQPDEDGIVRVDRNALGPHQYIHVVAVDAHNTALRSIALEEPEATFVDLRLAESLDPNGRFTQQKQVTVLKPGETLQIPDITTSRYETYDTIGGVYSLFRTLSGDAKLAEFEFITRWPELKPGEQRAKYSQYACHELNLFLYFKDPEFHAQVIAPYLENKRDKTFMDRFLIGSDLTASLEPWRFGRLNPVERILLGNRLRDDRAGIARHVKDLFDLHPPAPLVFDTRFRAALAGRALERDGVEGLEEESLSRRRRFRGGEAVREQLQRGLGLKSEAAPADMFMDQAFGDARNLAEKRKALPGRAAPSTANFDMAYRFMDADVQQRGRVAKLFRQLDKTKEWAENNYYKLPIAQQTADLVAVNAFWNDYAQHDPESRFLSTNIAEPTRNFTEMMCALAVLDLPFTAAEHATEVADHRVSVKAASPMIVFHRQIRPASVTQDNSPVLVSQNFYRHGDRYQHVNNVKMDKYVTDEFLVNTVYGCQVAVTNPSSAPQQLKLMLQIPEGAMPVLKSQATNSVPLMLKPFSTASVEYYFYFPGAGDFSHYPVQVSRDDVILAGAGAASFRVVDEPTRIDKASWAYVSQHGSEDDVLAFLERENLHRVNPDRIAWRMKNRKFFDAAIDRLARRHTWNNLLWSYGVLHNEPGVIREYLKAQDQFVAMCGYRITSPLLTVDPVERHAFEHLEYSPLVNARAHQLGRRRRILNDRMNAQYHRLLQSLSYERTLNDNDRMSVVYYLMLQDRVSDSQAMFGLVNPDRLETRLQYDYCAAYLDFFQPDPQIARQIVAAYADYPVDRWRNRFAAMKSQLDEIDSAGRRNPDQPLVVDPDKRNEVQTQLAAAEPAFEFVVERGEVRVDYDNLDSVRVNYYLMDIELLFSRNPFVQSYSNRFSRIRPNASDQVKLPNKRRSVSFKIPDDLQADNILVEIVGAGQHKTQAWHSNSMAVQTSDSFGQVKVTQADSGRPLPASYVKVYARMKDGRVRFFKDGYTDLRGRFDYASLSTNELDHVDRLSLLVMNDDHGAMIREVAPPKQ